LPRAWGVARRAHKLGPIGQPLAVTLCKNYLEGLGPLEHNARLSAQNVLALKAPSLGTQALGSSAVQCFAHGCKPPTHPSNILQADEFMLLLCVPGCRTCQRLYFLACFLP
jgi:hypothetical protein